MQIVLSLSQHLIFRFFDVREAIHWLKQSKEASTN